MSVFGDSLGVRQGRRQHAFSLSLLTLTALAVIATSAAVAALTLVQAKEMSRILAVMR